jgi:hypothetical protein
VPTERIPDVDAVDDGAARPRAVPVGGAAPVDPLDAERPALSNPAPEDERRVRAGTLWSLRLPTEVRGRQRAHMNREIAAAIGLVVLGLTGWIAYLAVTLPERYVARQWNLVWVGFDVVLTAVLAYAGWAAWFRRRIMVVTALVAGTLLICDAWFDVLTSIGNRDWWLTVVTAVGGEIPAALFFFWIARRILVQVVATVHQLAGAAGAPPRLRDARALNATDTAGLSAREFAADADPGRLPEHAR